MASPSPYEILGLSPGASTTEIRSAFREKVRASHPDTTASPGGDGDVMAVVEAYRQLMGGAGARSEADARSDVGSTRRVEVRRVGSARADAPVDVNCPQCGGAGIVEVRSACVACGGAGTITRLEAYGARVERCRRCRGHGGAFRRDICGACRGSGRAGVGGE